MKGMRIFTCILFALVLVPEANGAPEANGRVPPNRPRNEVQVYPWITSPYERDFDSDVTVDVEAIVPFSGCIDADEYVEWIEVWNNTDGYDEWRYYGWSTDVNDSFVDARHYSQPVALSYEAAAGGYFCGSYIEGWDETWEIEPYSPYVRTISAGSLGVPQGLFCDGGPCLGWARGRNFTNAIDQWGNSCEGCYVFETLQLESKVCFWPDPTPTQGYTENGGFQDIFQLCVYDDGGPPELCVPSQRDSCSMVHSQSWRSDGPAWFAFWTGTLTWYWNGMSG